jgi:MFS transporter, putative metabolite:H+ symporter
VVPVNYEISHHRATSWLWCELPPSCNDRQLVGARKLAHHPAAPASTGGYRLARRGGERLMNARTGPDRYQIAARMERLPLSPWHNKIRLIVGSVNFSDAFDALTVAYVLPALIPLWQLQSTDIGLLISIGYAGQVCGGILSGWLAEKYGRVPLMVANIVLFSVMSLCCILAQNFSVLLSLRFLQGIGLGGEVPIANSYINEFAKSTERGRFVLLQQLMFPVGLTTVALVGTFVVPALGWQWMFVLGGLPVLLALPMIRVLPESPRWLASRGRDEEADRVLTRIEALVSSNGARPLPPIPTGVAPAVASVSRFRDLFAGIYLKRTLSLWVLWFCAYLITYAMTGWLPSIMRTVYHLPVSQSNLYGFILNITGLLVLLFAAFRIDRIGRKLAFSVGFLLAAVPLFAAALTPNLGPLAVVTLATLAFAAMGMIPGSLGMYTAENYPNHLRAIGSGASSISQRLSSVLGPYLVGMILPGYGVGGVFGMFAIFAVIGGISCALFSTETAGKTLEQLSPKTTPDPAA